MPSTKNKLKILKALKKKMYHLQRQWRKNSLFNNCTGTIGHPHAKKKKEPRYRSYDFHEKQLTMDHRPKCKMQNYKTSRR